MKLPRISLRQLMVAVLVVAATMAWARFQEVSRRDGILEIVFVDVLPVPAFALFSMRAAIPFAVSLRPAPAERNLNRSRWHRLLMEGIFWSAVALLSVSAFYVLYGVFLALCIMPLFRPGLLG